MKRKITDKYRIDVQIDTIAPLPEELAPMADGIQMLIQSVYDNSVLNDMFSDGHGSAIGDIMIPNQTGRHFVEQDGFFL